ncbi:flagellar type III secretion system pore protein FliP [Cryptosporangium sp. NPDC048952]|uniref:flagellar type III secretion system pore protein FliP n=1 Tax=Cryptosporangium sp. NPDC048952 TaxID=3363961 RepID=UPI0037199300
MTRRAAGLLLLGFVIALVVWGDPAPAPAAPMTAPVVEPAAPTPPVPPGGQVTVNVNNGPNGKPSTAITLLIALTVLSIAPSVMLLCTCFTKVFVVLSIVRNALGLQTIPPNQVIAGLALFISIFIMTPVLSQVNSQGVQPYLKGTKSQTEAFQDGVKPLREFMLKHTRKDEIALMNRVADKPRPKNKDDVSLPVLIPAFVLSELRAAFIIGFVIFLPFIVVDMVVSASLMSLGMMMLPPVMVSLPFKLLLFVMSNGWTLVVTALVASYR